MEEMEKSDQELIKEHLAGDKSAFQKLINRHLKAVYNFTLRISGNSGDTEDVVQETFLKVWKNLKKFKLEQNFKTWLFTIARNTAIDWFRKKRAITFSNFENEYGENTFSDNLADKEPMPDELADMAREKKTLTESIGKLSALEQQIILLRANENLTFEEIGSVIDKPMNTVKSLYRRAMFKLKELLLHQKPI